MPVINSEIDRRTKKEAFWAEGIVEYVKLDKFDEMKVSYIKVAGQPDKKIESTHKASLLIKEKGAGADDKGVWVSLGEVKLHPEHENLQVKDGDKWITIEKGVEVTMDVKPSEWNGKTYYNSSKGKITVLSTEGVQQAQSSSKGGNKPSNNEGSKPNYKKRDTVGIETGHAVNGALELLRAGVKGDAFDLAGVVQSATVTLKAEIAKDRGVDVTDYDLGASVGHAILNACRDHTGKTVTAEEIIESAREVLALSDKVAAAIRGMSTPVQEVKKETKKVEKKEPAPKEPEPVVQDFDDDIPFAPIGLQYGRNFLHCF